MKILTTSSIKIPVDQSPSIELLYENSDACVYSTSDSITELEQLQLVSYLQNYFTSSARSTEKPSAAFIDLPFSNTLDLVSCVEDIATLNGVYCSRTFKEKTQTSEPWEHLGFVLMNNQPVELFHHRRAAQNPIHEHILERRREAAQILNFLQQDQTQYSILNIHAISGMGKTQLLNSTLIGIDHQLISFKHHNSSDSQPWWESLISQNESAVQDPLSPEAIANQILQTSKSDRLVVFDDFQWTDSYTKKIIAVFSRLELSNLKFIICSRETIPTIKCEKLELRPLSLGEINALLSNTCPHLSEAEASLCSNDLLTLTKGHTILCAEITRQIKLSLCNSIPDSLHTKSLAITLLSKSQNSGFGPSLPTLHILAQNTQPFRAEYVREIEQHFGYPASNITKLEFIDYDQDSDCYSFHHALYREAFLADAPDGTDDIQLFLAKHFHDIGDPWQSAQHWVKASRFEEAYSCLLTACRFADKTRNFRLLGLAATEAEKLKAKISINNEEHADIYWYLSSTSMLMGSLENAAYYGDQYLNCYLKKTKKRNALSVIKLFYFPSSPPKVSSSIKPKTMDRLCSAAFHSLEYAAFAEDDISILSKFIRFHSLSASVNSQHRYLGISHAYLAVTIAPLASKNRIEKLFNTASKIKNQAHPFTKDAIDFLRLHHQSQLLTWRDAEPLLDKVFTESREKQNFDIAAKCGMYKILYYLERNKLQQAIKFHRDHLEPLNIYLPAWIQSWINIVKFGILFASNSHHKTLFHFSKQSISSELTGGSHVFYAAAYAYCENYEKAHHHLNLVLTHFQQMKIHHSAFTLALPAFLEVPLILYSRDVIDKKTVKKFLSAATSHGKMVARSRGIVVAYHSIYKVILGSRKAGIARLQASLLTSEESRSDANSELIKAHLNCLNPIAENPAGKESPAQARIKAFWRIVTSS